MSLIASEKIGGIPPIMKTLQRYTTAMVGIDNLIAEYRRKHDEAVERSGVAGATGEVDRLRARLIAKIEKTAAHALAEGQR